MDNKFPQVTPETQRAHTKKIKKLLDALVEKESYTLTGDEIMLVVRALSCHKFVIDLDLERQKNEQTEINRTASQS